MNHPSKCSLRHNRSKFSLCWDSTRSKRTWGAARKLCLQEKWLGSFKAFSLHFRHHSGVNTSVTLHHCRRLLKLEKLRFSYDIFVQPLYCLYFVPCSDIQTVSAAGFTVISVTNKYVRGQHWLILYGFRCWIFSWVNKGRKCHLFLQSSTKASSQLSDTSYVEGWTICKIILLQ